MRKAWNVDEAAAFLGLAKKTLYKKAEAGEVPSFKVGNLLRFDPADLERWRDARKRGGS